MALKSEEELKEFLENLGTEYRFSCFKEKNAEGCHLLADYLEAYKRDFEAAAKLFKSNCDDHKYAHSCFKFASCSLIGKGIEVNTPQAFNYNKTACELGYNDGCLHVGVMLTSEEEYRDKVKTHIQLNYTEGSKYLEKACQGGNAHSCYFASILYLGGFDGMPKDYGKARELSIPACEGGNVYACMNLSRMYRQGHGVDKNEEQAKIYKEKAREIRRDMRRKPSLGLQQHT